MIKRLSIIGLVLFLVGIIGSIFTINTQFKQAEMLEEKVIGTNDFNNIDLYTNNAKITILPTDNSEPKVEVYGNYARYEMTADVKEDTLKVDVKTKRDKIFSFDLFSKNLSLTVYIPQKLYENINVQSNNGHIDIGDLEGSDINAETDNGKIHFDSVNGKTVRLETNNGSIDLQTIKADRIKAYTDNGKIEIEDIDGEIVGETNNGSISLRTDNLEQPIELQSNNGKIEIWTKNKPQNAILDLKTHNGKIRVFGESNWDTIIGNGDNLIKLTTENGRITIGD